MVLFMERTKVDHENPEVDCSKNDTYERDFSSSLLEFIKSDDLLKNFYHRFILECENIIKVIEKLENDAEDIGVSMKLLEKNINKFTKAEKPKELASLDYDFHLHLFQITNNKALLEMWQQENSLGFPHKIWQSICRDTAHRNKLCEIHYEIFEAINNKDRAKAISAMQKYYAVILIHYIQRLK
jgi:DNA-binding FadR family transcriptional regulator